MPMIVCTGCGAHYRSEHVDGIEVRTCPHCGSERGSGRTAAAVLLGLALAAPGCVLGGEPKYGVTITADSAETGDTGVTEPGDTGL
jgi:hypothetical protein